MDNIKQETINQQEWENPTRWYPRRLRLIYISRSDSRLVVPKVRPWLGWAFNFAHPYALAVTIGLISIVVIVGLALETVL